MTGYLRFALGLPRTLRHPIGIEQARTIVSRRLAHRATDFVELLRGAVDANPGGPYAWLLRQAGCELGDLEALVRREGIEGALGILSRRGVYLTVDEYKGRRDVVRGNARLTVTPAALRPGATGRAAAMRSTAMRSSGSRGHPAAVPLELAFERDLTVDALLFLAARGGPRWVNALWEVPGGASMRHVVWLGHAGAPIVEWFCQIDPDAPGMAARYRWSTRGLAWGSRLAGIRLPRPRHVSLTDPLPIARWMHDVLRAGGVPHVWTFISSAARVAEAALAEGLDLRGARFTANGEPVTAARIAMIARAGADAGPYYGSIETGPLGYGCLAPAAVDDMHVVADCHAVIRADAGLDALPAGALLVSSLRRTAPLVLLNLSLGDRAELAPRSCGCPLEAFGWTSHLAGIRSFEKLTAGGMTFHDSDVVRILEEVLPARCGGGPTHYQLLEEESAGGRPHLRLLVDPAVGPVDPNVVAATFFRALREDGAAHGVMGRAWQDAGLLRVDREAPHVSASGKILHLHVDGPAQRVPPVVR